MAPSLAPVGKTVIGRTARSISMHAAHQEPGVSKPARVFSDAQWEQAFTTATVRPPASPSSPTSMPAAAHHAKPEGRVFSDEQWTQAFTAATTYMAAQRAVVAAAAAPGSTVPASAAAAVDTSAKPDGRLFSDAQWEHAFASATTALSLVPSAGTTAAVAPQHAKPEGRMFSDAQWALAFSGDSGDTAHAKALAKASAPSLSAALAFSGAAPEVVNGRLAMLGFAAAMGAEVASGKPLLQQALSEPSAVAATLLLFGAASLVPILKGVRAEAVGPLTPEAELVNGRAAMVGIVAQGCVEVFAKGGAALF